MSQAQQLSQEIKGVTEMNLPQFTFIKKRASHSGYRGLAQMQVRVVSRNQTKQRLSSELSKRLRSSLDLNLCNKKVIIQLKICSI